MTDMLVRLYVLPDAPPPPGIDVRRALSAERHAVSAWIGARFGAGWAGEADAAFARTPTTCLIALRAATLLGFAVWDATALGLFGPMGVDPAERSQGIGAGLLHAAMTAMRAQGYAYAVIGAVSGAAFYERCIGATPIEHSTPGLYRNLLRAGSTGPSA